MAKLYSDEGFPKETSQWLRTLAHDVLTIQEANKANQMISDEEVIAFATSEQRAVLTLNRLDFMRLHKKIGHHAGIVVCSEDLNYERLAVRINDAISAEESLTGKLIRVNRPFK